MNELQKSPQISLTTPLAVVGVSQDPNKYGHRIFADLVAAGYSVTGVHPKGGIVAEQELFSSLAALTPLPHLVIVVVPPESALSVIEDCAELGSVAVWLQPGSDSAEVVAHAKKHGLSVTTGCIMKHLHLW